MDRYEEARKKMELGVTKGVVAIGIYEMSEELSLRECWDAVHDHEPSDCNSGPDSS